MGRGRAKAKQAKVARKLKYDQGGMTDLERLRRELVVPAADPRDDAEDHSDAPEEAGR